MKKKQNLLKLKLCALALSSALGGTLTACSSKKEITEKTTNNVEIPVLDQFNMGNIEDGMTQIIEVPNNNFSLEINYKLNLAEDERWTLCDNKSFTMEICTRNLKNGLSVYIDNIHTNTSIVSYNPYFNGILQDESDDRIHSSTMLGFPISNDISYVGISQIEGQSKDFIENYSLGLAGYSYDKITTQKRLESDYLAEGVYANQMSTVIDLIVRDEYDVVSSISVNSDILVKIWPIVAFWSDDKTYYQYYYWKDNKLNYSRLTSEEYDHLVNNKDYGRILK